MPKTCCLLLANSKQQVSACIAEFLENNQRLFNEERDKLERWADDKLQAAEDALKQIKARLAQLKRDARNAATLQEQESIQREISDLERQQRRQRQEIFIVEDEIIEQRDALIDSLQERLQETTEQQELFSVRWRVVQQPAEAAADIAKFGPGQQLPRGLVSEPFKARFWTASNTVPHAEAHKIRGKHPCKAAITRAIS